MYTRSHIYAQILSIHEFHGIRYTFCIYVLCIWLHIMYTRYTYWSFTLLTCSIYTLLYIIILIAWHSINAYDKLHIYAFTQDLFAIYESIVIYISCSFFGRVHVPWRITRNIIDILVNRVIGTNLCLQLWTLRTSRYTTCTTCKNSSGP